MSAYREVTYPSKPEDCPHRGATITLDDWDSDALSGPVRCHHCGKNVGAWQKLPEWK